ncbi:MAG: TolC family protein [Bacteroidales bacterium]|nr:TolC family protein [Bacteroidales bacterium]
MKRTIILIAVCLIATTIRAQQIDYTTYIQKVLSQNPAFKAAQLDLEASQADLKTARKITDPVLSAEYGNNSDWDIEMGESMSIELSKTISLGKRSARIHVAENSLKASEAGLLDFTSQLRTEATNAYLDALLAQEQMRIAEESANNLAKLYQSDSLRAARGDISELDALQSKLEANIAKQDHLSARAKYQNALLTLGQYIGQAQMGTSSIAGHLAVPNRTYHPAQLIDSALAHRQDLLAAQHLSDAAQSELTALRRERTPDIDIALGANYNTRVRNEEAPAPQFIGYTAGISIPLPVSNLNRGEVRSGQIRIQQAQLQTEILRNQIQVEILQAYNNYQAAISRAADFDSFLMETAQQVLQGRLYAYSRGETTLLEVLNAQHTYNEIQQAYAEALHDCMQAWVELNRAAAIWDIDIR